MPSQNNFHVPHLCGGILFNLLLETRKTRGKIRDRAHISPVAIPKNWIYI